MTATTRSASSTPPSMSLASSEASLTLCSGTLRTSIGAGTGSLFLLEDGAGVVAGHRIGDVFQGGDDGAAATAVQEPECRVDLGSHAAARELTGGGELAQLCGSDAAEGTRGRRAEVDHHVRDIGGDDQGVGVHVAG